MQTMADKYDKTLAQSNRRRTLRGPDTFVKLRRRILSILRIRRQEYVVASLAGGEELEIFLRTAIGPREVGHPGPWDIWLRREVRYRGAKAVLTIDADSIRLEFASQHFVISYSAFVAAIRSGALTP